MMTWWRTPRSSTRRTRSASKANPGGRGASSPRPPAQHPQEEVESFEQRGEQAGPRSPGMTLGRQTRAVRGGRGLPGRPRVPRKRESPGAPEDPEVDTGTGEDAGMGRGDGALGRAGGHAQGAGPVPRRPAPPEGRVRELAQAPGAGTHPRIYPWHQRGWYRSSSPSSTTWTVRSRPGEISGRACRLPGTNSPKYSATKVSCPSPQTASRSTRTSTKPLWASLSEEHEEGTIIQTFQRGYVLNGKPIRTAKVVVAKQA